MSIRLKSEGSRLNSEELSVLIKKHLDQSWEITQAMIDRRKNTIEYEIRMELLCYEIKKGEQNE